VRIAVVGQFFEYEDRQCDSYLHSMCRSLSQHDHDVSKINIRDEETIDWSKYDFCLNVDSGRDRGGRSSFLQNPPNVPSAVYFVDTHGQPTLHKRLASNYTHVFFAVWHRRDVFAKHKSAHWCPNFTDIEKFDGHDFDLVETKFDFGFFGSKGGLGRTTPLIEICQQRDWKYDIRQCGVPWKHRWPRTQKAMAGCNALFNHGQKHDGPNLRVMESMAMNNPLITDVDSRSGMDKLFEDGVHYLGYDAYTYKGLEKAMNFTIEFPEQAARIAEAAYREVREKHLVGNRIEQILETANSKVDLGKTGPCHKDEYL